MNKLGILPDRAAYSVNQPAQVLRADLDGGASRWRQGILGAYYRVTTQFTVDKSGYNYLRQIYRWSEKNGCPPFLCDLIIDTADVAEYTVTLVSGSFKLSGQEGEKYTVTMELEVAPDLTQATTWPTGYTADVIFKMIGNGANNATTFKDSSVYNRTISVFGNTKVTTTAPLLFGDSNIVFDGTGDYLEVDFGNTQLDSDFTIEGFVTPAVTPTGNMAFFTMVTPDVEFYCRNGSGNALVLYDGANRIIGSSAFVANTFQHVVWQRKSGSNYIAKNGVWQSTPWADSKAYTLGLCRFGSYGTSSEQLNGRMGQWRITRGSAMYDTSANFTPPSNGF